MVDFYLFYQGNDLIETWRPWRLVDSEESTKDSVYTRKLYVFYVKRSVILVYPVLEQLHLFAY